MNLILSQKLFEEQTKHFSEKLLKLRSWSINEIAYPTLDVTFRHQGRVPFRVRMRCNSYDELPCTIELLKENGDYYLKTPIGTGVINNGRHPITNRPFICSPGSLEYHTHPSHLNDAWDNYRNKSGYDLGGMMTQIYNAWLKTKDVT